jgi:hypothetical protein
MLQRVPETTVGPAHVEVGFIQASTVYVANPCSGAVVAFEFPCIFDDFVSVKAESTVAAVALALGAVTTEIAESEETIKAKAIK